MSCSYVTTMARSLELLFPKECLVCRRPIKWHHLCFRCTPAPAELSGICTTRCAVCFGPYIHSIESETPCPTCLTFPPLPDRIRFLWDYGGLPRDLIRTMKYRPSPKLTRLAGSWMAESLPHLFTSQSWDLITPIPSSPIAYRKRLFHPCAELARLVARQTPRSAYAELLRHSSPRSPHALSTHDQRLRNLKTIFECKGAARIVGKRILLIEDVITTGATIAAAAFALRRAGAAEVSVFALAKTHVWNRFRSRVHSIFSARVDAVSSPLFPA